MAFTVTRSDGATKDAEFEAYARLLRQQGIDLGKLPRAPSRAPGVGGCMFGTLWRRRRNLPTNCEDAPATRPGVSSK